MDQQRENPFRPGTGKVPPHLAGHEAAVRHLTKMMGRIVRRSDNDMVVLYGPRGTGKTALLGEFYERARKQKVRAIKLSTSEMPDSPATLADMMAPTTWFAMPVLKSLVAGAGGVSGGVELGAPKARSVGVVMRKLLRRPLLLMVDEAHTMLPGSAKVLLQISQECINERLPLLLVLAGTPGIRASLGRADASFWERATRVRIGRLESKDATRIALSLPAENSGLPFAPDALEFLVEESQDYPYFIQLVGDQSWDAAIARDPDATHIGLKDAQAGVLAANKQRNELYAGRLLEVDRRGILPEAVAVSRAFHAIGGDGVLPGTELERALMPVLPQGRTVNAVLEELFAVGLVWQTDDPALWEPGIPSLCTHIAKYALTGGYSRGVPVS